MLMSNIIYLHMFKNLLCNVSMFNNTGKFKWSYDLVYMNIGVGMNFLLL